MSTVNRTPRSITATVAAIAALHLPYPALGTEKPELEEIVVTASFRDSGLHDTPASVSVLLGCITRANVNLENEVHRGSEAATPRAGKCRARAGC